VETTASTAGQDGVNSSPQLPAHLLEYRKVLVAADQKGQEEIDKAILALSGGGLGVSLVFIKDVIGSNPLAMPGLLMAAWVAWGVSTLVVLLSFHFSNLTIREGIRQIDSGTAYTHPFGGRYANWTQGLNGLGAGLFFIGVVCMTMFAFVNLPVQGALNGDKAHPPGTAASAGSTTHAR
jgi:hypothetical protein